MVDAPPVTREDIRGRKMATEDMIRAVLVEISRVRMDVGDPLRVAKWSEGLEALADLAAPWANLPSEKDKFQVAWDKRPVAIVRDRQGRPVPVPTARDCRAAQAILLELLARNGLMVKTRTTSGPAPRVFQEASSDGDPVVTF